jgi:hypothetical protein
MPKQLIPLKRTMNKIHKAKNRYDGAITELEETIKPFANFDFTIFYQPSDGFVILPDDTDDNMPVSFAIEAINRDGKLTYDYDRDKCDDNFLGI